MPIRGPRGYAAAQPAPTLTRASTTSAIPNRRDARL